MCRLPTALLLLLLASPVHALEPPPVYVGDLTGGVHGGFDRVNQFAVRTDGRVYIADSYHHRVVVYSPDGVYLEQLGSAGTELGQFDIVSGIAFDADNDLFVANQTGDRITKLSPTHLPLAQFGTTGTGPGQLQGPDNLAVSPYNGRLYVTELFGDRVSMFDTDGSFVGSFGSTGSGPGQFDHPAGIVVDENGDVFVADQFNHRIERFDPSGNYVMQWGGPGSAPGQFNYAVGLALDGDGNLYATDQLNNRVQKFTRNGTLLAWWGSFGTDPGQMYNPWAVQPLSNGQIWVGDTWNHRINIYGPGSVAPEEARASEIVGIPPPASGLESAGSALVPPCGLDPPPTPLRDLTGEVHGGFDRVNQLARRFDGRIYLADAYNHRVLVYSAAGVYLEQIGSHGDALGQFDVVGGVALDGDGDLFVASQAGNRITKLSRANLPLGQFGAGGTGPGQMQGPDNLAISPDHGRLYVTELFGDRVSVFDTDGDFVTSFGATGTAPGQFDHPAGILVDGNGDVFVADQFNHRIERFDAAGVYLSGWGALGDQPGEFHYVVGLGLDDVGDIYATDQLNNRVQKFQHDGTPLAVWGSFGHGPGQMYNPWAVLPLPNGEIWVGDTYNYRVSIYGPGQHALNPEIVSIEDVSEDNGFQVRIHFLASSLDVAGSATPILQYEAFRRIDAGPSEEDAPHTAVLAVNREDGAAAAKPATLESSNGALLAGWEFVGAVPAHAEDEYSMVAPTLVNSSRQQRRYSVFFLRAATAVPSTFFDSCPDSGESVDNLPPVRPTGFAADLLENGDVALTWEPNAEADLLTYSLYRGATADFTPSATSLIATTDDLRYVDGGGSRLGERIYYKLSASDRDGNESGYAAASLEGPVSLSNAGAPAAFALYPASPNPMTERTTFQFDLPIQSEVSLRIFDLHGRLIRTIGTGVLGAGRYHWEWTGRDAGDLRVPAGVYFYRLQTPFFSKTKRLAVTG